MNPERDKHELVPECCIYTHDTNGQTTDFIHGMFASAFYPTISRPTRVTQQTVTLIDNIITNMHEYPVTSGILYNDISDHFPVFNFYSMEISKGGEIHDCLSTED